MSRFALSLSFIASTLVLAAQVSVDSLPKPTGYVSDLAHVVSPADKQALEVFCTKVEQQLGAQFALVTIDSIGDQPIRDFALEIARKWGVGPRKSNQGVLLLLVIKDHKDDIETGRGIEPYLTDGYSGSILRSIRPQLRAGDYGAALINAAAAMAQHIAQQKGIAFSSDLPQPERRDEPAASHDSGGIPVPVLLILGVILLIWLFGRAGRGGGGFWTGILLGNLLRGGRSYRGGWPGGGWGGGGFGGGSGGGGGFGGFGGGDFGGGGASSNW